MSTGKNDTLFCYYLLAPVKKFHWLAVLPGNTTFFFPSGFMWLISEEYMAMYICFKCSNRGTTLLTFQGPFTNLEFS